MKKIFIFFAVLFLSIVTQQFTAANRAGAVSSTDWDPGYIISDSVFTNSNSMTVNQIQAFLNSRMPTCDNNGTKPYGGTTRAAYGTSRGSPPPYTCLKDYSQSGRSAARIIYDAGKAHSINPQVILATLQKENSLITDDWPWPYQYRTAMGYGCPDTAPCDAEYFGFTNQVNKAAWQFRRYLENPSGYNFSVGTRFVRYSPNASCGGTNVFIRSAGTAALYNYTPYQPNSASINSYPGSGNTCSSYGNRNFWYTFNEWFGWSTRQPVYDASLSDQPIAGNWSGSGNTDVGVIRKTGTNFQWFLDHNSDQITDETITFGIKTDTPLVGDWDGDGDDDIGVNRISGGGLWWYLDSNGDGVSDKSVRFGIGSDSAFVGDWNYDGVSDIGVARAVGSNMFWYLDYNFDGITDKAVRYGIKADQPIVGDWDGDGSTDVGIIRTVGNDRIWYLDHDLNGTTESVARYGIKADQPIVGDWDGDGSTDVGIIRTVGNDRIWYLDHDLNGTTESVARYGIKADQPIVGDWDGDGSTDVGVVRPLVANQNWYFDYEPDGTTNSNLSYGLAIFN
jgi:hypothetical protein